MSQELAGRLCPAIRRIQREGGKRHSYLRSTLTEYTHFPFIWNSTFIGQVREVPTYFIAVI